MALHHKNHWIPTVLGTGLPMVLYCILDHIGVGLYFGRARSDDGRYNALPGLPNLGLIIGLLGTVVTVLYMIFSKLIQATSHEEVEHKLFSLRKPLYTMLRKRPLWGPGFCGLSGLRAGVYAIGGEQIIEAAWYPRAHVGFNRGSGRLIPYGPQILLYPFLRGCSLAALWPTPFPRMETPCSPLSHWNQNPHFGHVSIPFGPDSGYPGILHSVGLLMDRHYNAIF